MCGISGFLHSKGNRSKDLTILKKMNNALVHRGPDDFGEWIDESAGIALAQRRLSIIDTSYAGHQPMHSTRYILIYNGEIYNHNLLREELQKKGHFFNSKSDTEVLLFSIMEWGIEPTLNKLMGMFAFALWDKETHTLTLARDRMGEKPIYYGWQQDVFLFGSELKALKAHPKWNANIDRNSLAQLLRYNYIPSPNSIYSGIKKIEPGSLLKIKKINGKWDIHQNHKWWSIESISKRKISDSDHFSNRNYTNELDDLLNNVVDQQRIADVPIGTFLSGGVDSSLVSSIMQSLSAIPIETFTIGYKNSQFDESRYAEEVAKNIGANHTNMTLKSEDLIAVISKLPEIYDEPFADVSQLPTYMVSKLASKNVSVVLTGDGGDELFGGYNRYIYAPLILKFVNNTPLLIRSMLSKILFSISPKKWGNFFELILSLTPKSLRIANPGDQLHKIANIINSKDDIEIYERLISFSSATSAASSATWPIVNPVIQGKSTNLTSSNLDTWNAGGSFVEKMMFTDASSYLSDDILVKVDRASMSVSLETRAPLLDVRIAEFAIKLPITEKIQGNNGKKILKDVLYKYVPKNIVERPKMGFGVPIGEWLRGPLKMWAEELLSEEKLKEQGYFEPSTIRIIWREHLDGNFDRGYMLWCILMFQLWLTKQ